MSRKDAAIVRGLLPDETAIEAYYLAKGRTMPAWVKTAVKNYWSSVPDERLPILALRALRPHLEKRDAPNDLKDLFIRLAALCELFDNLPKNQHGHKVMNSRVVLAWVAIFNLQNELERKHNLGLTLDLNQEVPGLEPWEKVPPASYPQG
jgi:hypothetical protein